MMMSVSIHVIPAILGIPLMFPLLRALASRGKEGVQTAAAAEQVGAELGPEHDERGQERGEHPRVERDEGVEQGD